MVPFIVSVPHNFIYEASQKLKETIRKLRDANKIVMLATNSEYSYTKNILKYVLGENYLEYFDFICVSVDKPLFWNAPEREFHAVDSTNKIDSKGPGIKGKDFDFVKNQFLIKGNADSLIDFAAKKFGKKRDEIRAIYHGDSTKGDVQARYHPNWDCAFIFDELDGLKHPKSGSRTCNF